MARDPYAVAPEVAASSSEHSSYVSQSSVASMYRGAQPLFGNSVITYDLASFHQEGQRRVVWKAHETNCRCELLVLDARIAAGAGLGSRTSSLGIMPPLDDGEQL